MLDHLTAWLPRLAHPVRSGEHPSTAFALGLVLDAVDEVGGHEPMRDLVAERTRAWFLADRDCPVDWEPGGSDFLSPALVEADLVRRVLPPDELRPWLAAFLPRLGRADDPLLVRPEVTDPTDGKGAHLYGLALSRAAALRHLAPHLGEAERERIHRVTAEHVDQVQRAVVAGDFMATHWLVSFALLALTA